jgi:hypothetical protein
VQVDKLTIRIKISSPVYCSSGEDQRRSACVYTLFFLDTLQIVRYGGMEVHDGLCRTRSSLREQ